MRKVSVKLCVPPEIFLFSPSFVVVVLVAVFAAVVAAVMLMFFPLIRHLEGWRVGGEAG